MGAAFFYHLTDSPLEVTLPMLIGKARTAGWRIEVRGTDDGQMRRLDEALWRGPDDGFLPHGLAGGPHDALQPVLLTVAGTGHGSQAGSEPGCLMTVDGAEISPEEVVASARACILFDGHDPDAVQTARRQWSALTKAGVAAQYWAQVDGRWTKQAEKG